MMPCRLKAQLDFQGGFPEMLFLMARLILRQTCRLTELLSNSSLTLSAFDCSGNANGGKLTTDGTGVVSCADDVSSAGGGTYSFTPTTIGWHSSQRIKHAVLSLERITSRFDDRRSTGCWQHHSYIIRNLDFRRRDHRTPNKRLYRFKRPRYPCLRRCVCRRFFSQKLWQRRQSCFHLG